MTRPRRRWLIVAAAVVALVGGFASRAVRVDQRLVGHWVRISTTAGPEEPRTERTAISYRLFANGTGLQEWDTDDPPRKLRWQLKFGQVCVKDDRGRWMANLWDDLVPFVQAVEAPLKIIEENGEIQRLEMKGHEIFSRSSLVR